MDLTDIHTIKNILWKHHLWAKKGLGQNFLLDRSVLDTAIQEADVNKEDTIVEIGPGLGTLTRELCKNAKQVIACEIDRFIIPVLKETTKEFNNLQIEEISGLKYYPYLKKYKIVANIPYYITGKLLRHFLEEVENKPETIVLLVQKEVAEKITDTNLNLLAIGVQVFGKPTYIQTVKANSFYPVPKVESALIKIEVYKKPIISVDIKDFFHLVHYCFQQRRKKLRSVLKGYAKISEENLKKIEKKIDLDLRPEKLSLKDWENITQIL